MNIEKQQSTDKKTNLNIRLSQDTRDYLDRIYNEANSIYSGGNKVKNDLILNYALRQLLEVKSKSIKVTSLKDLRLLSRNVEDDWSIWETIYIKITGDSSPKGFKGFTMSNEWFSFMKKYRSDFDSYVHKTI